MRNTDYTRVAVLGSIVMGLLMTGTLAAQEPAPPSAGSREQAEESAAAEGTTDGVSAEEEQTEPDRQESRRRASGPPGSLSGEEATLPEMIVEEDRRELNEAVVKDYDMSKAETTVEGQTVRDFNSMNAYDALRIVPGVGFFNGSTSRFGQPTAIRGASDFPGSPSALDDFPTIREAGIGGEGASISGLGGVLPTIALERIQVKKGSLGVRYSGQAEGGVIVNRIKRGRGDLSGTLWAEYGTIGEQLHMADAGFGTDEFDLYAAGKFLDGNYDDVTVQAIPGLSGRVGEQFEEAQVLSGLLKGGVNLGDATRLGVLALGSEDRADFTFEVDGSGERQERSNQQQFYGFDLEHQFSDGFGVRLGYTRWMNDFVRSNRETGQTLRDRPEVADTLFGSTQHRLQLSEDWAYTSSAGFEIAWHEMQNDVSNEEYEFQDRSVSYFNTLSFREQWFLNAGTRYVNINDDFLDDDFFVWDLGMAFVLPGPKTKLWGSYSTGYSRNKGFAFFFPEPGDNLKVKQAETAEFGIEQPFFNAKDQEIARASVTVFNVETEDGRIFNGWPDTVYTEATETVGVELYGEWRIVPRVKLLGSFTYQGNERTGIWAVDIGESERRELGLEEGQNALRVRWINDGIEAGRAVKRAGLREGDLIVGLEGQPLRKDERHFQLHIRLNYEAGDELPITILRDGQRKRLRLPLVED